MSEYLPLLDRGQNSATAGRPNAYWLSELGRELSRRHDGVDVFPDRNKVILRFSDSEFFGLFGRDVDGLYLYLRAVYREERSAGGTWWNDWRHRGLSEVPGTVAETLLDAVDRNRRRFYRLVGEFGGR